MTDQTKQNQTINFSTNITIITLNANGLRDDGKRQKILQAIQNKRNYITLLQETHSKPEQNAEKHGRGYPIGIRVKYKNLRGQPLFSKKTFKLNHFK